MTKIAHSHSTEPAPATHPYLTPKTYVQQNIPSEYANIFFIPKTKYIDVDFACSENPPVGIVKGGKKNGKSRNKRRRRNCLGPPEFVKDLDVFSGELLLLLMLHHRLHLFVLGKALGHVSQQSPSIFIRPLARRAR